MSGIVVHALGAGRAVLPLDALEVVARAEAATGAGEDHRTDVAVDVDPLERRVQLGDQSLTQAR